MHTIVAINTNTVNQCSTVFFCAKLARQYMYVLFETKDGNTFTCKSAIPLLSVAFLVLVNSTFVKTGLIWCHLYFSHSQFLESISISLGGPENWDPTVTVIYFRGCLDANQLTIYKYMYEWEGEKPLQVTRPGIKPGKLSWNSAP